MERTALAAAYGTVAAVLRYPTKALAPETLAACVVEHDGLAGDRVAALAVAAGHARIGKPYRGKEERRMHTFAAPGAAIAHAAANGVILEATHPGRYFDARPVSVLFDAWVAEVARLAGTRVDPLRFRANLHVACAPHTVPSEAALVGTVLAIADVRLRVVAPITRCVTPSYDIASAEPDEAIFRAYATGRGNVVGVYCEVACPGTVSLGDTVASAA
jgi:uncharacterized protein YcbX